MPSEVYVRVLVVEDETKLASQLSEILAQAGYSINLVADGEAALQMALLDEFAAIVLDLGLPSLDGLTVLERWRKEGMSAPVLVLTARDSWTDKVAGLDAGADDYLAKPFSGEELVARVRALIRRPTGKPNDVFSVGAVSLDERSGRVTLAGEPVKLTAQEYRLLSYLMQRKGHVASRAELNQHIYGQDFGRDSNSVEVFVTRLRKKIGPDVITTVRGAGYCVEDRARP